ncbi:amino acid permease, partial [bacterium]|nr:amino acid permease [bacterium]
MKILSGFWATKDTETLLKESREAKVKLKRILSKWDLVAFGIGSVVGAGIFTVIGTAAAGTVDSAGNILRMGAGPGLIISFVIAGLACTFCTLCYAEFASMIPISGSAYTYAYAVLGEFMAWIIAWNLILEYCIAVIAVAISWSAYTVSFLKGFGIYLPVWLSLDYKSLLMKVNSDPALLEQVPVIFGQPFGINVPAILIVVFITIVLVIGIRESSRVNTIMVVVKMAILLFFIVLGLFFIKPVNFSLPEYGFFPSGWSGVMTGSALIFFAYIGFDAITTVAEETKNPQKDLPFGIIGALV